MNESAKTILGRPYFKSIQSIEKFQPDLYDAMVNLDEKFRNLVRIVRDGRLMQISIQGTDIKLEDEWLTIVALQDIRNELEEKELESWQKLIRVLNHEIMNSVIPISTLTEHNRRILEDMQIQTESTEVNNDGARGQRDRIGEIIESMKVIEQRSKGIVAFANNTRKLTKMPQPTFRNIHVQELLHRVYALMKPDLDKQKIDLVLGLPEMPLHTKGDLELIEQVLINLIKNAGEAHLLSDNDTYKKVKIDAAARDRIIVIHVSDNGPGIPKDKLENIFVPFYTTKKDGSGVGLAVSRQIMRLHHGSLHVQSEVGKGTIFTLSL
jgi:signal transduction histidine kinase